MSGTVVRLSVNVNKVATLRNSRGGAVPSVLDATRVILEAGARGITVHPRADERHITGRDVRELAELLAPYRHEVEFNIEGDPRPDLLALVREVRPHQCTLVPVRPGEITSQAGWPADTPLDELRGVVADLRARGVRTSLFVEAERDAIDWAASVGADRVELYTEPFARAFEQSPDAAAASFARYAAAAQAARRHDLGVNAGHDLDLRNLVLFRTLPHLAEVSIGHALISHALFVGLPQAVRDYLAAVRGS
ncbi:MAG TPA: pyridoxine 5'-phosphate synthase [Vicinamibacterales bacterium]|nr:pyridoxine 5'-phosphate synthase [Vicinamibacterales bacterium]